MAMFLPWICLLMVVAASSLAGIRSHYLAPAAGCIFALLVQSIRHLRASHWPGRSAGRMLGALIPTLAIVPLAISIFIALTAHANVKPNILASARRKPDVEASLLRHGGKQLVLVHYDLKTRGVFDEWVTNPARIDDTPVVWAHDMGEMKTASCWTISRIEPHGCSSPTPFRQ